MAATEAGATVHERLMERIQPKVAEPSPDALEETPEVPEVIETQTSEDTEEVIEQQDADDGQDAKEEAETPSTDIEIELSDLAGLLGADETNLSTNEEGKVTIRTKIDGEEREVTLNDLTKSYQLEGHLTKKSMELSESQKTLEIERQRFQEQSAANLSKQEDYIRITAAQLTHEYNNVDWAALERNDPTQYNLARTKFEDRKSQIQQAIQVVNNERKLKAEQDSESQRQALVEEQGRLLSKLPAWNDPDVYTRESRDVSEGLIDHYGFTPEEAGGVSDHRHILIARDALAYRKLQDAKPEVKKKVRAARVVAKQRANAVENSADSALRKGKLLIKKTGGKKGIAQYLLDKGIV